MPNDIIHVKLVVIHVCNIDWNTCIAYKIRKRCTSELTTILVQVVSYNQRGIVQQNYIYSTVIEPYGV